MERPITRSLLATFIEYAATDRVTLVEWDRFACNHYKDEVMENARRECVRIVMETGEGRGKKVPKSSRDRMFAIAQTLRENSSES